MILNMHIRNDYKTWLLTEKNRVTTLCGKITATKFTGIPGITPNQPAFYDGKDFGWCPACCQVLVQQFVDNSLEIKNEHLKELYHTAVRICGDQIVKAYTSPK